RSLLRTAGLILLAYVISELIYWRWVVPELRHLHHVPLAWWIGVYEPFGFAAVAAGALLTSMREIPFHACIAASVPAAAPLVWSLIPGASVAHDTDTGLEELIRWNPSLWAILLAGFAMMAVLFAAAMALGRAALAVRLRAG